MAEAPAPERVVAVLGGRDASLKSLAKWANSANFVIAADSAADALAEAGGRCDLAIGDLDSIGEAGRAHAREIRTMPDQDSTDCDKLLDEALRRGVEFLTLVGLEGDRLDHVLSSIYSVLRSPVRVRFVLRQSLAWLVRPGDAMVLDLHSGSKVSVLPVEPCEGVHLSGVRWPLDDEALSPRRRVSISNEATGGDVRLSLRTGAAVLFAEYREEELPWW